MSGLSDQCPTERFTGLAGLYAQCRPGYPDEALDFIVERCGLGSESVLVDVGCGTGISARLFARRGVPIIGIEPNAEMRAQAEDVALPPGLPAPVYRAGRAEATGLPATTAAAVLAAQAFHWFDPDAALREFHRILKPGGWVALMWNERDPSDLFTAAYGAVIKSTPEAAAIEGPRSRASDALLSSPLFEEATRVSFANAQVLDQEGVLGRAFSVSYAPREPQAAQRFADALRTVFAQFELEGRVVLQYNTSVFSARRKDRMSCS
ncbi:MAG TPA: class I SAM-dependent methyltransferase [Gemmataceae bacterium]|jgi:SAM-dependent methyltransferase|nr:class I SAM-dependent methyltransferase [Gemmataceae bacterium]